MAEFERYDHSEEEAVLKGKGLLAEIEEAVKELPFVEKELIWAPKESLGRLSFDELKKLPERATAGRFSFFIKRKKDGWGDLIELATRYELMRK